VKRPTTRALAVGSALTLVGSIAGIALTQTAALAGSGGIVSYEYDCNTALQAGTNPFQVIADLTGDPDPSFYSGGTFAATGSLTFPIGGGVVAGFASNGITSSGLTPHVTIASTDGSATGSYVYNHAFPSQPVSVAATVTGVSWANASTTLNASAGSFSPGQVGFGVSGPAGAFPVGETIIAVSGAGDSATLALPTTAAGGPASVNLYAPMVFTDNSVDTGSVFTTDTTNVGDHANVGLVPGTATSFTFTTSLIPVQFGGITGVGNPGYCVQTGYDASNVPGPTQSGPTPALPPEAFGGATALLDATTGFFSQTGTAQQITPPTAAFVVGDDPAPTANNSNVNLGVGGSKTVSLSTTSSNSTSTTDCDLVGGSISDLRLAVTIDNSPGICSAHLTDSGSGPATVTFQFTASDVHGTGAPGTVTVNIGTPPVDEPITETVNAGQLVVSCVNPSVTSTPLLICPTLALPSITLNGVEQTVSGAGSTIYVSDNRGDPAAGWSLTAAVVPSSNNPNSSCDGLAVFCNGDVAGHALDASGNGQIAASNLSIGTIGCTAHAGNLNPAATPGAGGTFASTQSICSAAAGSSGGTFDATKQYTLTIPASVYAGTYYGTVEYLVS
jgi:hypothetical protein